MSYQKLKQCIECKVSYTAHSANSKRCSECRRLVRNARERDRRLRKHEHALEVSREWHRQYPNYNQEWRQQNLEHCQQYSEQYRVDNPEVFKKARKKQRQRTDPYYRLSRNIRARIHQALKRQRKGVRNSVLEYIGCSVVELKEYLEERFVLGMSWSNYGQWHVDHIEPLAKFDLGDEQQLREACHYSNLQPLWATDNLRKGAKRCVE